MTVALVPPGRRHVAAVGRWSPLVVVLASAAGLLLVEAPDWLTTFATVFLGILFEALPFLVLGVLVSAGVQAWLEPATVQRLIPGGRLRGALAGALFGAAFPVCECSVVPVARRLLAKGATVPAALGLMLAGPVVNPVVFLATWTALGPEMAAARTALSLGMAVAVAWLYGFHPAPATLLRSSTATAVPDVQDAAGPAPRAVSALAAAGDELLEMTAYLVLGAAAAAALRTLVPATSLMAVGQGPVLSVALMMLLAALLSICSTVDAFVALSFTGVASSGALLAFLVFGPVVDLKSVALYAAVFRWQTVAILVLLLSQMALLAGIAINFHVG